MNEKNMISVEVEEYVALKIEHEVNLIKTQYESEIEDLKIQLQEADDKADFWIGEWADLRKKYDDLRAKLEKAEEKKESEAA